MSGALINGTGRLLEVVTCRGCGTKGLEDSAADPLAGYCPRCFEDLVASAFGFDLGISRPADDGQPRLPGLET